MSESGAEKDVHKPLAMVEAEGMPFVRCSCDPDGMRPQSAVWLREHWQGDEHSGVTALREVVARQARRFTADEVIEIANETSDSFGNLYRLDFIDRIEHEARALPPAEDRR